MAREYHACYVMSRQELQSSDSRRTIHNMGESAAEATGRSRAPDY